MTMFETDTPFFYFVLQKDHFAGDRYKEFLKEQKKREEDLAAKRKSTTKKLNFSYSSHNVIMKKIDSPDNVSLIKKQLEAQTRKHDLLKNQIPDHEQFLKVSTKQCSFFILRQESGCSGYQIIATCPLKKFFLSVFFFSCCGLVFCCASLIVSA